MGWAMLQTSGQLAGWLAELLGSLVVCITWPRCYK